MKITVTAWKSRMKSEEMRKEDGMAHEPMPPALCRILRDLVCEEQDNPDCSKCPLRSVDCYSMDDNLAMQTILMELFGSRPAKVGEAEKERCHSDATESPVAPVKCKTGKEFIARIEASPSEAILARNRQNHTHRTPRRTNTATSMPAGWRLSRAASRQAPRSTRVRHGGRSRPRNTPPAPCAT